MKSSHRSTTKSNLACLSSALVAALLMTASPALAQMPRTPTPEGAVVYFITPKNEETLTNPITVRFGLRGMGVGPAGLDNPATGHHHLIIDSPLPKFDLPIPNDAKHKHFGGGQTEVTIDLPPGKHTLQLIVGDKNHVPHVDPIYSKKIRIEVK